MGAGKKGLLTKFFRQIIVWNIRRGMVVVHYSWNQSTHPFPPLSPGGRGYEPRGHPHTVKAGERPKRHDLGADHVGDEKPKPADGRTRTQTRQ